MLKGELDIWERFYLPTSVKGKTILDIGAGCGETALFYFHWGASRVTCIEKDRDAARLAKRNLANFGATVLNEPFSATHLDFPHDFMKMDIEGAETALLSYDGELKPCVIECHDQKTEEELQERFGLKKVYQPSDQVSFLSKA
jgi:predicted RNA methylase